MFIFKAFILINNQQLSTAKSPNGIYFFENRLTIIICLLEAIGFSKCLLALCLGRFKGKDNDFFFQKNEIICVQIFKANLVFFYDTNFLGHFFCFRRNRHLPICCRPNDCSVKSKILYMAIVFVDCFSKIGSSFYQTFSSTLLFRSRHFLFESWQCCDCVVSQVIQSSALPVCRFCCG